MGLSGMRVRTLGRGAWTLCTFSSCRVLDRLHPNPLCSCRFVELVCYSKNVYHLNGRPPTTVDAAFRGNLPESLNSHLRVQLFGAGENGNFNKEATKTRVLLGLGECNYVLNVKRPKHMYFPRLLDKVSSARDARHQSHCERRPELRRDRQRHP